jgi:hypothetical protein
MSKMRLKLTSLSTFTQALQCKVDTQDLAKKMKRNKCELYVRKNLFVYDSPLSYIIIELPIRTEDNSNLMEVGNHMLSPTHVEDRQDDHLIYCPVQAGKMDISWI